MPVFSGVLKVRVCEAVDLKPTPWALRHAGGKNSSSFLLDPYLTLNLDQTHLGQTCTKNRSNSPAWNQVLYQIHLSRAGQHWWHAFASAQHKHLN